MSDSRPFLSVLVPAHQAVGVLRRCLGSIVASDLPREEWELIVVDDASTDETSLLAAEYADTIVRLAGKPHGPAFGRNRGFEASRGTVVLFVDADVAIKPDVLRRIVTHFRDDPGLASVFGSYDAHPEAPGLVSQYRNLLHHYVHQRNPGPAETFWAGIGAIRSSAFAEVGMFDEWSYGQPQIEDIELGRRLRRYGHRILLDPGIQGTHLKRWTLSGTLRADFQHRGVPWMWLMIQEAAPGEARALNIKLAEQVCTAAVGGAVILFAAAAVAWNGWLALTGLLSLSATIAFNWRFYRFLAGVRGSRFMVNAIPLHLAYYLLNTLSAVSGWTVHHLFGEPVPSAGVAAHAQLGVDTWPPPPRRPVSGVWSGAVHPQGKPEPPQ